MRSPDLPRVWLRTGARVQAMAGVAALASGAALPFGLPPDARSASSKAALPAGALADASCDHGLCGPPGVRGPLPAGSLVRVRRELCPVRGCGSGWGRQRG